MTLFLSFFVEDSVIITLRFAKKPIIPKVDWETTVNIGSFCNITAFVSLLSKPKSRMGVLYWNVKLDLSISIKRTIQILNVRRVYLQLPQEIQGFKSLNSFTQKA